jgi:hypothetical protein
VFGDDGTSEDQEGHIQAWTNIVLVERGKLNLAGRRGPKEKKKKEKKKF